MENVKYHTVKYGFDLYSDAQARVYRASHEKAISVKNILAKEVTKGSSEFDFLDINEVIVGNIKGGNADAMILFLFE